jgi:prepilin-type N-terminal cleavage/methylation domain-containing protein
MDFLEFYKIRQNNKGKNLSKGFSLIELIVVMIIIVVLAVIVIPFYRSFQEKLILQRAAIKLAQSIRKAENMAISTKSHSGEQISGYGIYLKTVPTPQESYVLFVDKGNPPNYKYDPGSEEIETISFEKGVKIKSLDSSHLNVIFSPPNPVVFFTDGDGIALGLDQISITISLEDDETKTKTITVNKAGLINAD